MKLLLDTHLLLWAAVGQVATDRRPTRLSAAAADMINDPDNDLNFSSVNIWEVAIKYALRRPDFKVEPHLLRRSLLDAEYVELPITGEHAAAVRGLPMIHKDPFDRMLVAQAMFEGMLLLTVDRTIASYSGPIRLV